MFKEFKKHIDTNFPDLHKSKVLVAISGGLDSVVLARFLHDNAIKIALVHCNFQLREEESNQDQLFVEALAEKLNCPCFVTHFDTKKEAESAKESIQLTARKLRYKYFDEVADMFEYEYIATAHHLNDSIENYVMHSIRGTGIKGLLGVPKQTLKVIRPLLPFSKNAIQNEAEKHGWDWREDASNQKNTYFRNRIRNKVIPLLEEENPNLLVSFQHTLNHLQQTNDLLEEYTTLLRKELISTKKDFYSLSLGKLRKFPNPNAVLYQLLYPFGFTDWESVYDLKYSETGKQLFSETHSIEKNRNELLIYTHNQDNNNLRIFVNESDKVVKFGNSVLQIEKVEEIEGTAKSIAYVDAEKLVFPLSLRQVNKEDVFVPLGMKGSKKVNHFLRDEKVPTFIKKQTWVLCSDEAVVWVVNHRINEKFKITEKTNKCLRISCIEA